MTSKTPAKSALKIEKLSIKNFLGIKELEITPDGEINFITGKNGAGKSTILKAIEKAFEGFSKKDQLLSSGEESGEILLELNKFNIKRTFTEKTRSLTLTNDEGMKFSSPQQVLDSFIGEFAFNPIEFAFADVKKRNEILLNALDIKYSLDDAKKDGIEEEEMINASYLQETGIALLDDIYKKRFEERTDIKRRIKQKESTLEELKEKLPEGVVEFDQEEYSKTREKIEKLRGEFGEKEDKVSQIFSDIQGAEELRKDLSDIVGKYGDSEVHFKLDLMEKALEEAKKGFKITDATLQGLIRNEEEMRESMKSFELQTEIKKLEENLPKGKKQEQDLDEIILKIREEIKPRLIKEADLGIKGLEFTDQGIMIDGIQLENLSESEKLKLGVKIARKLNSEFGIICIDGVEKLDPESLKEFSQELSKTGFQSFLTSCWGSVEGQNYKMSEGMLL